MSETLTGVFVDAKTGETIERQLTADEQNDLLVMQQDEQDLQNDLKAKADARESALAKLAALGLTQEEIDSL